MLEKRDPHCLLACRKQTNLNPSLVVQAERAMLLLLESIYLHDAIFFTKIAVRRLARNVFDQ
jgi:hypothetical protein